MNFISKKVLVKKKNILVFWDVVEETSKYLNAIKEVKKGQ